MSYTADRHGTAYIDVETLNPPPPTATATRRVTTHARAVTWFVRNYVDAEVTVCLTNFRPHRNVARPLRPDDIEWPQGNCAGPLARGGWGRIIGIFQTGAPGDVYDYDIEVNGVVSTDPQLEI